jgi:hypothetical protein
MKRAFPLFLLALGIAPASAQLQGSETVEEFHRMRAELMRKQPQLPHTIVTDGSENPSAIPLHVSALLMLDEFRTEVQGMRPATVRFADRYGADSALASRMVAAIRQTHSDLAADAVARVQAFCARSFTSNDSWKAAMRANDADVESARVSALDKLREVAGPELWERIVLAAGQASRGMGRVQEDYDSIAAELGYEVAFSNQCRAIKTN